AGPCGPPSNEGRRLLRGTGSWRSRCLTTRPLASKPPPYEIGLTACVEYLRDLVTRGLGRVADACLVGEDRNKHVLQDVGRLDVGPVRRVGGEPAVLGGGREDRRQSARQADQRGRVGDDAADGHHLALELGAAEKLDPLARQVLVLALGRDAKVRSTKEHGRCLAGCVAREW